MTTTTVVLDGALCIHRAAEVSKTLDALLASHPFRDSPLALDVSGVTEIDSAGVQLLVRVRRFAMRAGGTLTLIAPSSALVDVLSLMGMTEWFGQTLTLTDHG